MSIKTLIRSFWTPKPDKLIAESSIVGKRISPESAANTAIVTAEKYALGIEGRTRWAAWRSLVRLHQGCNEQLRCLTQSHRVIRQAKEFEKEDDRKTLLECFSSLVQGANEIDQLEEAIKDRTEKWNQVDSMVREARPKVFVTHAFLMLEDISGVQIASLFIAGLLFWVPCSLGAFSMRR